MEKAWCLKGSRLLPYLVALLLLTWALSSLARSQAGGVLVGSYWILYIVYNLPLAVLGLVLVLIVFIAWEWKGISDHLGRRVGKKMVRKKVSTLRLVIMVGAWGVALAFLSLRCGGIPCARSDALETSTETLETQVTGTGGAGSGLGAGFQAAVPVLNQLVQSDWFLMTFLALLVAGSVIFARSVKVAWGEAREEALRQALLVREEGLTVVREGIKLMRDPGPLDPRTRIMACYMQMIKVASDLGAPVTADKTARELESGLRHLFLLKGAAISELTQLFEEARYSLHPMTVQDSDKAYQNLVLIEQELGQQNFGSPSDELFR